MNASATLANSILKLFLQNHAIAGIGDASGLQPSAVAGNVYFRLCTDAVAVDKDTLGTECAYTGYVTKGIAVPRAAADLADTDELANNANEIVFGACTAGEENVRYLEIWKNNTGDTEADRLFWFQLTNDLAVSPGITPKFAGGAFGLTVS